MMRAPLLLLAILLTGCAGGQRAVTNAANLDPAGEAAQGAATDLRRQSKAENLTPEQRRFLEEAAALVQSIGDQVRARSAALVAYLDARHAYDRAPTMTAEKIRAEPAAAAAQARDEAGQTGKDAAANEAAWTLGGAGLKSLLALLGVSGPATIALLLAKLGRARAAIASTVAYGRQVTQIAEAAAPDLVEEIKGQFAAVQDDQGIAHLIRPVLAALKAAEPVTTADLPRRT